jgi:hypothetical protein
MDFSMNGKLETLKNDIQMLGMHKKRLSLKK